MIAVVFLQSVLLYNTRSYDVLSVHFSVLMLKVTHYHVGQSLALLALCQEDVLLVILHHVLHN